MRAWLSILGMYQYDATIFDKAKFPDGIDRIDMIDKICSDWAELEVLYTRPDTLKEQIGLWCRINLSIWDKLYKSTVLEYNPIENYHRYEFLKDTNDKNTTENRTTRGENNSNLNNTGGDSTTTEVSGFNSSDWANSQRVTTELGSGTVGHEEATGSDDRTEKEHTFNDHTGEMYGNIGVTSSQELIQKERDISVFSVYQFISDSFRQWFCIGVY